MEQDPTYAGSPTPETDVPGTLTEAELAALWPALEALAVTQIDGFVTEGGQMAQLRYVRESIEIQEVWTSPDPAAWQAGGGAVLCRLLVVYLVERRLADEAGTFHSPVYPCGAAEIPVGQDRTLLTQGVNLLDGLVLV